MGLKLKLSADEIFNREFAGNKAGYDCLQVDTLLDSVISDYETFTDYYDKTQIQIDELTHLNKILNERINRLETDNSVLKKKLQDMEKPIVSGEADTDNLDLLKRISKLEELVYSLGGDPSQVK